MALGIPMALLYGSLASGGISALGSMFGNKGNTMRQGYDIIKMPQYPWTEGNRNYQQNYYRQGLEGLNQGQLPAGYQAYLDLIKKNMGQDLYETYYGRPGDRTGQLQTAMEMGTMAGLGPKQQLAQAGKVSQDYASKERAIDTFLAEQGINLMGQEEGRYLTGLQGMAAGPETVVSNLMGGTTGSGSGQALGNAMTQMGQLPWSDIFSSLNNKNQWGQATPYSGSSYYNESPYGYGSPNYRSTNFSNQMGNNWMSTYGTPQTNYPLTTSGTLTPYTGSMGQYGYR